MAELLEYWAESTAGKHLAVAVHALFVHPWELRREGRCPINELVDRLRAHSDDQRGESSFPHCKAEEENGG